MTTYKRNIVHYSSSLAYYSVAGILVLLPFHALITTWLGSNFGYIDVFRIWKEVLMIPLGVFSLGVLLKDTNLQQNIVRSKVTWCIAIYTALFLVMTAFALSAGEVNAEAAAYSLVTNLRFLWFFLIVWIISWGDKRLVRNWYWWLLVPASLVIFFGVLQRTILPADVLRHVGYGDQTIPAVQTVDQKLEYRRIQSTLRGANPLGAYLIVVMTAFAGLMITRKQYRKYISLSFTLGGLVLFFTYSRSAWLGLLAAISSLLWFSRAINWRRQAVILCGFIVLLVGGVTVWQLRDNNTIQNTLFHSDETSRSSQSSNFARQNALLRGARDVASQPLGRGPGTAGPASFRNNKPPRIAENYFLQIGQEVGVIGLGLFIGINALIARALWRRKSHLLAQVLLASLVGITVTNLLSHAWADDTLALLWWGLAGIAMALPAILEGRTKEQ